MKKDLRKDMGEDLMKDLLGATAKAATTVGIGKV